MAAQTFAINFTLLSGLGLDHLAHILSVLLFRFSKWMIVSVENEWFNLLLLTLCVLDVLQESYFAGTSIEYLFRPGYCFQEI